MILEALVIRTLKGGKGEGGRGLYFLEKLLIKGIKAPYPPLPLPPKGPYEFGREELGGIRGSLGKFKSAERGQMTMMMEANVGTGFLGALIVRIGFPLKESV